MAYIKTNWVNDVTPLNATNMNHIESGIENLDQNKQNKLTAGANITIDANNVISASGGEIPPATKITLGGVYMWEDAEGIHIWNIDPQEVNYTEQDGVYEIKTLNYTKENGIYNIGGNE